MVRMGITTLPSVVNACIMTSAWSCGLANSFTASRVLYSLALRREAPRIFARTYKGVPVYALLLVIAFGCLSFLSIASSAATAFSYILNITGALWIVNMALQQIIYIRFRSGVAAQAIDRSQFPFFKKHQLYFSWIAFFAYTFLFLVSMPDLDEPIADALPDQWILRLHEGEVDSRRLPVCLPHRAPPDGTILRTQGVHRDQRGQLEIDTAGPG